jgi:GNAT superfamily N-acetyltransferase
MRLTVLPLTGNHAEPAADLVCERLAVLRREVPELPATCGDSTSLAARIERLAGRGPGVAAFADGRLVGFLGALPLRYGGRSSMLSPEWGNGATPTASPDDARRITEALYTEAAREWTARGAETHLMALLANDGVALETFSWIGFGRVVCDAVRPLTAIQALPAACAVRRAEARDAELVCELDRRLHEHTASSPVFLLRDEPEEVGWWTAQIADPKTAIWIAEESDVPVGYLIQGPAHDDACDLIVDPGTSSITGAYVVPEARGQGVAVGLLSHAVEWSREQGYARLSVDFETANIEGARFWLSHFRPVVVSLIRTIRADSPSHV